MDLGHGALVGVVDEAQKKSGKDVLLGDLALGPQLEHHSLETPRKRRRHPPEDADEGLGREVRSGRALRCTPRPRLPVRCGAAVRA